MIRSLNFRMDVLRDGVRLMSLPFSVPPNILADSAREIKTSLSGTFANNDVVDWMTDRLQPVVIIDGVEQPYGVYVPATLTETNTSSGAQLQVEAYDLGYILTLAKTETIYHIPSGTSYLDAIQSLLVAAGLTLVQATPNAATLQTDREDWDVGTSYLTIINQLLSEINYQDIWFDANGSAILEPALSPTAERIGHSYDATNIDSVTHRDTTTVTDMFGIPNVFIALCSNPDYDAPMMATSENNNAQSKLSIANRGMRIPQVYKVNNIASMDELQAYADRLRDQSMLATEITTIQTAIMPGHGLYDVVALRHPAAEGIYLETGWEFSLQAGTYMTHRLKKVVFA